MYLMLLASKYFYYLETYTSNMLYAAAPGNDLFKALNSDLKKQ